MQERNAIPRAALGLLALIGLLIHYPSILPAQTWTRLGGGEQDGGVVEDIQLLSSAETGADPVIWAASMGTGLFRNSWTSNSWDHDWTEFLPGKGFFGVDAITVTSGPTTTEHVIAGTGMFGILYQSATGGNFSLTGWNRPQGWPAPPDPLDYTLVHDVAFHYESGSYADPPTDKYFAIFVEANAELGGPASGLYRWNGALQPPNFSRADGSDPDEERDFQHFYRDKEDKNALYVIGEEDPSTGEDIKLYRISGSYSSPDFDDMDLATMIDGDDYIEQAYGISQWDAATPVYTYLIAKYRDHVADQSKIAVFVTHDLHDEDPISPSVIPTVIYDDEFDFMEGKGDLRVVGRPHGAGYHYLWLGCLGYGMFFYDTEVQTLTQITGTSSPNTVPDLMRWTPRAVLMDLQGNISANEMHLFYGTHHKGIWYLTSTLSGGNWTHEWEHLENKFYGNSIRDLQLYPNTSGGTVRDVLAPSFDCGMYRFAASSGTWSALGTESATALTHPGFDKGITPALHWSDGSTTMDFFGTWAGQISLLYNSGSPINMGMGGLFSINSSDVTSRVDFDPDQGQSGAGDTIYTITEISSGQSGNNSIVFVAGTRESYYGTPFSVICCKLNNSDWDRIYYYDYDNGRRTWSILPDLLNPTTDIYIGRGSLYGIGSGYDAEVDLLHQDVPLWSSTEIWTSPYEENTSVSDITAVRDPEYADKLQMFWGVIKSSAQTSAVSRYRWGTIMHRYWDGDSYEIEALYPYNESGTTTIGGVSYEGSPGALSLSAYKYGHRVFLAAILIGDTLSSHKQIFHLFRHDLSGHRWTRWGTPATIGGDQIYPASKIVVDELNGFDYYVAPDGGPLFCDNRALPSPMGSTGWNWISFNCIDAVDSLKYLFAGADSLEVIRDQYHHPFKPNDNPPVDSIYVWNWTMGYAVRTSAADTVAAWGSPLSCDSSMVLLPAPQDSSWIYNFIAYLPTDTFNVNECFLADSDTVLIVKQDDGNFWRPGDGDDFDMTPGEGYQVGVNDTMTFQYPASQGNSIDPPPYPKQTLPQIASLEPSHFQFTEKTGDFYPIYIEDILINGQPPQAGDEAAVFAPNDLCVGAVVYEGSFPLEIAGWKDDPCTEAVDGYIPGDTLSFELYDASAGVEVPLEMMAIAQSYPPSNSYAFTRFEQGYYA